MGKKYDRYVAATRQENKAKQNAMVAEGGSTREHFYATQDAVWNAKIDVAEAWDEVMKDPEG